MEVMIWKRIFAFLLAALFLAATANAYVAPSRKGLERDVKRAKLIVRAVCNTKEAITVPSPRKSLDVPAVSYRFQIKEVLKGDVGGQLEIKQLNLKTRSESQHYGFILPVRPTHFEVGQEYLLFLGSENRLGIRRVLPGGKYLISNESVSNVLGIQDFTKKFTKESLSPGGATTDQKLPKTVPYQEFISKIKRWIDE